jgi:7-cyano-7-deazaguanine synthase
MNNAKVICLGGGLDSTALLIDEWYKGTELYGLYFYYGQKAVAGELKSVKYFCQKYKVPLQIIKVEIDKIAKSDILKGSNLAVAPETNILEGRNGIFASLGVTYASTIGAKEVLFGFHEKPATYSFPDSHQEFVDEFNYLIDVYVSDKYKDIRISAPFAHMTRQELFNRAYFYDKGIADETFSCYEDTEKECGKCSHCIEKQTIVSNAQLPQVHKNAVNLISGGIDSAVVTLRLLQDGYDVYGVMFNYGQENFDVTFEKAKSFTDKYKVPLKVIDLQMDWVKSSILKGQKIDEGTTKDNLYLQPEKPYWVPARNGLFLALAGSYASSIGAEEVYASFQMDTLDWGRYDNEDYKGNFASGDLTPFFMRTMNDFAECGYHTPVKFIAPFIDSRAHAFTIALEGKRRGLDFDLTYSCRYTPVCEQCPQCLIRKDRIDYARTH